MYISIKLAKHINNPGFGWIHINTVLDKWFTTDSIIAKFFDLNDFIVIPKDFDFKNSFLIKKTPRKLTKINLGNTSTAMYFSSSDGSTAFNIGAENGNFIKTI